MKRVDKRIGLDEMELLSQMIGRRFESYCCDEFHHRPAVYQVVFVEIGGEFYAVENIAQSVDYFGSDEEVGVLSIRPREGESASRVKGGIQARTPIGRTIENIKIINDTYQMAEGGEVEYEISFTKAIVFCFGERQVAFEKDVWFSEDIFVYRGSNVEGKIASVDDDKPESYDGIRFESDRETVCLAC